jgi:recombination protein RecA
MANKPTSSVSYSAEAELALIRKKLKHFTTKQPTKYWLDTGDKHLNSTFGSERDGVPYGKLFELAGWESNGKTAQMLKLMGMAQKDGAKAAEVDLEGSWDPEWARQLGVNPEEVLVFQPEIGLFGDEKEERMQYGEEVFEEVDLWLKRCKKQNPNGRIFLGVDSIAAIMTEEDEVAGIENQNMRTKISQATFLSRLLRRWVALARATNAMMFFINQLRVSPGVMFGNPEYTPGGNAVRLYSSVRVRMRRKGKPILKGGKKVGIKGKLQNYKNKAGNGSREGFECGYKLYFDGKLKYVDVDEIKIEGTE